MKLANEKKIEPDPVQNFRAIPGKGLEASVNGVNYIIASRRYLIELNLTSDFEEKGETVSYLINKSESKLLGLVTFQDALKPEAKPAVDKLKSLGIKTMMLTGDNKSSAARVARELGIDDFKAEVLPSHKSDVIQALREKGEIVGMVGDGINDAPALASANVGIAMSTGTDVAMESAGITLMRGNPLLIPDAIDISRRTYAKIKQNLFWAFFYNVIGIPLAAMGYLSPVIAGAAMALSSVSVVTNSLLLKRWSNK
jgi:Cu+-exporting ATPase